MKVNRQKNQLRIIGGAWRGRQLAFAPAPGLRPTPDRLRETLFNWLAPVIHGARCLDLYAGSGALGMEAASRGAADVFLIDAAGQVVSSLREQVSLLNATQVQVVQADVLQWLNGGGQGRFPRFDIVFLDPPFREQLLPGAVRQLETGGWLADRAWIYIEAEKGVLLDLPENWEIHREKHVGQIECCLVRRS